jgi:hypothetical protein
MVMADEVWVTPSTVTAMVLVLWLRTTVALPKASSVLVPVSSYEPPSDHSGIARSHMVVVPLERIDAAGTVSVSAATVVAANWCSTAPVSIWILSSRESYGPGGIVMP